MLLSANQLRLPSRQVCIATFLYCCSIALQPLAAQSLQNDQFSVNVIDNDTVSIAATGTSSWDFDLSFSILSRPDNPNLSLEQLDLDGARYRVPRWDLAGGGTTTDLFQAGILTSMNATGVSLLGGELNWTFPAHPDFSLNARMSLAAGNESPALMFEFTPNRTSYYGIGYTGAPSTSLTTTDEIWQPLVWQEKRFPTESYLTPSYHTPVPTAFVTQTNETLGVVADPAEFPYEVEVPTLDNSRFGVAVRDQGGNARPMLFAPVLGGQGSLMQATEPYEFTMRPYVTPGETEDAFERVARDLYGFHDYRHNGIASLNTTLENMVSYGLSSFSNFSDELKGASFQNDVPGAVKNNSTLDALGVAMLTDNQQIFDQRAYPTMEYMISRNNLLFTPEDSTKDLSGPVAGISELAALHQIFNGATSSLQDLAIRKYTDGRGGDINNPDPWGRFYESLYLHELTGDPALLNKAINGADQYIADRIDTPQTTFRETNGGGMFFWTSFVPDFAHLYELHERTGEQRFLDAAHESARRFAQFVWMTPSIPNSDLLVNEGDQASVYGPLSGFPPISIPEELAPAWRLSEAGLTAEGSGTSHGHRAIFMAQFAPWLLRIGHDSNDLFLQEIARSAIIGRYANFPGYHINTERSTVYEKDDYPLREFEELSYNSFHYSHVWPAMTQILDFLVSEASVLSDSAIDFPSEFIDGSAYFQSKFYGGKTGQFFDYDDAVLWMPGGLADFDSMEVNYISARGDNRLYMALMNTLDQPLTTTLTLDPTLLPQTVGQSFTAKLWLNDQVSTPVNVVNGEVTLTLPAGGLASLAINGLTVATQLQDNVMGATNALAWDNDLVDIDDLGGRGMVLNLGQDLSSAFVYLEDSRNDYDSVTLHYTVDGSMWQTAYDSAFPFEFTVPLGVSVSDFDFYVEGLNSGGQSVGQSQPYKLSRFAVGGHRTWAGTIGVGTWDISTSQHWRESNQLFSNNHNVTFNDQASGNKQVNIPANVEPLSVAIDTSDSYSFSGSGAIAGTGRLTKRGTGNATFSNPLQYTGETRVEEGTMSLTGSIDTLGSSRIVVDGQATLDVSGNNSGGLMVANQTLDVDGQVVGNVTAGSGAVLAIAGDGINTPTSRAAMFFPPSGASSSESDVRTQLGGGNTNDTFDLAVGSISATSVFRSLLAFDLTSSGIPDPSFIDEVKLTLTLSSPSGAQVNLAPDPTVELHQLDAYNSDTVSFATQPAFADLIASITGPNFASGYSSGTKLEWTEQTTGSFIDAVRNALGNKLYLGAKVDNASENVPSRSFYFLGSTEDTGREPVLEITYLDPLLGLSGIGTGTISGDYEQMAAATLEVDLYSTSLYDQLIVDGVAMLDGILDVQLLGDSVFALGDSYQILTAAGGVTGTFASEIFPDLGPLLKLQTSYEFNGVTLEVVPVLDGDFDLSGNVDGLDFLTWQRNPGIGNLADWEVNYGASLAATPATVPEPAPCSFLVAALLLFSSSRNKWARLN